MSGCVLDDGGSVYGSRRGTNLVGPYVAAVKVGVAGGRVDAVLLKVLTDVLRGGLGQQPVNALPGDEI